MGRLTLTRRLVYCLFCQRGTPPSRTTEQQMTPAEFQKNEEARIARMIRELQSNMADLVASGDITEEQANEWVNHKADQWSLGL